MEYCTLYPRTYKSGEITYGYREKDLVTGKWKPWKACEPYARKDKRLAQTWVGMRNAELHGQAQAQDYGVSVPTTQQKAITLKALLEWDRERLKIAESTRYIESCMANVIVAGLGEHVRASELSVDMLNRYIQARQDEGKKPRTINLHLQMLKAALNRAVAKGKLARLPVEIRKQPPKTKLCNYVEFLSEADSKPMTRALKAHEAGALLATILKHDKDLEPKRYKNPDSKAKRAAKQKLHDTVSVLLYSGLRKGEVFGLRWKDVDLELERMSVTTHKGGVPRTDIVPLSPVVSEILHRRFKETAPRPDELIFGIEPSARGKIRNGKTPKKRGAQGGVDCFMDYRLRDKLKRYARLAGIKRWEQLRIHDLRHTFCTELARSVPLGVVQGLARHTTVLTTMRYIDKDEAAKRDAVANLAFNPKVIDIANSTEKEAESTPEPSESVSLSCHFEENNLAEAQ